MIRDSSILFATLTDSNDIIKVEIWDVVDKGVSNATPKSDAGIKLEHNAAAIPGPSKPSMDATRNLTPQEIALDATNINVYRNTHGVIFLFDITKSWTFEYVVRELDNVPATMTVLVLGNFSDLSAKRAVDLQHIQQTLSEYNHRRLHERNANKANLVRYIESSMLNGLGLKFIYRYLGVPFLELQNDTLRQQLELKTRELATLLSDLDTSEEVPKGLKRRKASALPQEETRLDKQHEQMQTLWDAEDEGNPSIDDAHSNVSNSPPPTSLALASLNREASPTPPTSPVRAVRLTSAPPAIASSIYAPDFDAGELEDDFFAEEAKPDRRATNPPEPVLPPPPLPQDSDDEWGSAGGLAGLNPMVATDEDLDGIDYDDHPVPQTVSPSTPSFPSFRTTEVVLPARNVWDMPDSRAGARNLDNSDDDSDALVAAAPVSSTTRVTHLLPSEVRPVVVPHRKDAAGEFGFAGIEFEGFAAGGRGYEEIGGAGVKGKTARGRRESEASNPWALGGKEEEEKEFYQDDR
ncbi:hypothetical protein BC936DRAFT_141421, partial [Jimgerdemannia flammicorona]